MMCERKKKARTRTRRKPTLMPRKNYAMGSNKTTGAATKPTKAKKAANTDDSEDDADRIFAPTPRQMEKNDAERQWFFAEQTRLQKTEKQIDKLRALRI